MLVNIALCWAGSRMKRLRVCSNSYRLDAGARRKPGMSELCRCVVRVSGGETCCSCAGLGGVGSLW